MVNSSTTSLKKHWYILSTDSQLEKTFQQPPRVVFKRASNINQMVVISDLPSVSRSTVLDNVPNGNYRCGRCNQCSFTNKCTMFNHPITGKVIKIKGIITCSTKKCDLPDQVCGLCYVGKTKQSLTTRSNIRTLDQRNISWRLVTTSALWVTLVSNMLNLLGENKLIIYYWEEN